MYIHEAINNTTPKKPFITRLSWVLGDIEKLTMRILPTNTPDCCVMVSDYSSRGPCRGWQPRAEDLAADDWVVCFGSFSTKASRE